MTAPTTGALSPEGLGSASTANTIKEEHTDHTKPATNINKEIGELARQLSRVSTTAGTELQAFSPQPGSKLDPNSTNFDPRVWVKAFVKLVESEEGSAPPRSLGVAFKNLNVFGWGSGAEHQKTFVDYPMDAVSYVLGLVGGGKKRRVDILRNFEGVIEQGELLLVLGPPGSGCSTLLKTIAGETAGLEVGSDSYMNFRGKPPLSIISLCSHIQVSTRTTCAPPSGAMFSTMPKSTVISPILLLAKHSRSPRAPIHFDTSPAA